MDKLASYFEKHKTKLTFISFPLFPKGKLPCKVTTPSKKITFHLPWVLQYLFEGVFAAIYYNTFKNKPIYDLAICGDPLSFLQMFMFRKIFKIKKIVYFNVDFSTQRYQNQLLNQIYQSINRFAYVYSDFFIALTPKFIEFVDPKKEHVKKSFILTHWINRDILNLNAKRKAASLIYAGSLTTGINFESLFQAIVELHRNNIECTLDIYGSGNEKKRIEERIVYYNLQNFVQLKGIVDNTTLTKEIFPKYMIGVCPYIMKGTVAHADHMFQGVGLTTKLVEYTASGLPIVTTPLTESFSEITTHNFGFLVKSKNDWYEKLFILLTDKTRYTVMQKNALKYAVQFDEESVLTNVFGKMT